MSLDHIEHIRRFYGEHKGALFVYALSLVGSREGAEDVVHSVVAEFLERDFLPGDIRPYAFRCVRNRAVDVLRRIRRDRVAESIFEVEVGPPLVETRLLSRRVVFRKGVMRHRMSM